jgi:hypothetical protein
MDVDTAPLLTVIGALAANQIVMRVGGLRGRPAVFWSLQLVNVAVGGALVWFGLPGFEHVPVIGWVIGLLFFLRVMQNNQARARFLQAELDEGKQGKAAQIRRALQGTDDE